jgi:zinc protease
MAEHHTAAAGTGRVEEVQSPGGVRAYLMQDHSLPILSLALRFAGGAGLDPPGLAGLAHMTTGLIDEGAGDYDNEAFRAALEDNAIRLGFEASRDSISGELKTLTHNRARALELLRLALTRPRFDAEPVERIRSQIEAELRRRSSDPEYVAVRAWNELAFDGHPYARPVRGTPESLAAITVADMRGLVARRLGRDRLVVGVSGDITALELAPALDEIFGELPAMADAGALAPPVIRDGAVRVVPMAIPQSVVHFGHAGIPRRHPDHYAANIANYILGGGGFSSRLLDEIREKRGLAYSVYSHLDDIELAPLWVGGLATRNEQVAVSLEVLRAELARMAAGDVGEGELADAKTYLTGSFPLRLTSNDLVARALVGMQVWGLGLDFLDRRNALIEAVTLDDVRRVARALFSRPLLVTIVGAPQGVDSTI